MSEVAAETTAAANNNQEATATNAAGDAPSTSDAMQPTKPEVDTAGAAAATEGAKQPEAEAAGSGGDAAKQPPPNSGVEVAEKEKKEEAVEKKESGVGSGGEAAAAAATGGTASEESSKDPESPKPEAAEAAAAAAPPAGEELETSRVVIVTGASSGIGYHTARLLCARKHDVVLACRNEQKAQRAVEKITRETPDAKATFMQLDLADFDSVRTFVENFRKTGKQLSALVNNAGMILNAKDTKLQFTKDSFELTMATNHLGHFLLTNLLLDDLKKAASELGDARVVIVTSALHDSAVARKKGGAAVQAFDIDDPFLYKDGAYSGMQAYKNSKLANVMFAYELARKLADSGVKVNAVDPGFVPTTELLRSSNSVQKFYARYVLHGLLRFTKQTRSGAQAGADVSGLAVANKFKDVTGKYMHSGQEAKSSDESLNESLQKKLWELSAGYAHLDGYEPLTATRPAVKTPPVAEAAVNGMAEKDAPAASAAAAQPGSSPEAKKANQKNKEESTEAGNVVAKETNESEVKPAPATEQPASPKPIAEEPVLPKPAAAEKPVASPKPDAAAGEPASPKPVADEPVSTKPAEDNVGDAAPQKVAAEIVDAVVDNAVKVVDGGDVQAVKIESKPDMVNGSAEEKAS